MPAKQAFWQTRCLPSPQMLLLRPHHLSQHLHGNSSSDVSSWGHTKQQAQWPSRALWADDSANIILQEQQKTHSHFFKKK